MIFQSDTNLDRADLNAAFLSKDPQVICDALVTMAFYEADWNWAQEKCLSFLKSSDIQVAGLAATCLGHIARIHRRLDKERVLIALRDASLNTPFIAGKVEDALDDIDTFIQDD
ncbi:hypothetical protein H8K35_06495 [Undibacterium sp. LX40W]|uniref:HEAT repeat domain-containing protein n=1 Tax=Undibacterium nitidum TaxID=2762298 RepID=A0A923HIE3_9BURK|nr:MULTISPECIES: hypothetical protein [Undibacterium]MBC3879964.1 hypothetical protein [Undibacterium nitidum]MBC3891300.1 hypothetical protein [Undibacterium sp. LX40W]